MPKLVGALLDLARARAFFIARAQKSVPQHKSYSDAPPGYVTYGTIHTISLSMFVSVVHV
jgi:hypothetical protein